MGPRDVSTLSPTDRSPHGFANRLGSIRTRHASQDEPRTRCCRPIAFSLRYFKSLEPESLVPVLQARSEIFPHGDASEASWKSC